MSEEMDKELSFHRQLVQRYTRNNATEEELEVFFHLLQDGHLDSPLVGAMNISAGLVVKDSRDEALAVDWPLVPLPGTGKVRRLPRLARFALAAALLLLIGVRAWWVMNKNPGATPPTVQSTNAHDVAAPATNRAIITLGNGEQVNLHSAGNGALAQQGNTLLMKLANSRLAYKNAAGSLEHPEIIYNTLTNPRGSQMVTLTLTDGTQVWLNAESSIRYPVAFTSAARTVELIGEAYFETAQEAKRPFIVKMRHTSVEVLGTGFNINAYDNEKDLRVTVLQGYVKVQKENSSMILQPGQQAIVNTDIQRAVNVDIEAAIAWKNDLFFFSGADLSAVMRELARWYNVEVTYEGSVPNSKISGKIGRNQSLNQLLRMLAAISHLHYSIEGKQLTIRQ